MTLRPEHKIWGAQAASLQLPGASRQQMREAPAPPVLAPGKVRRRRPRALPRTGDRAFTIIELLIVMSIIIVLAGLVLGTSGYVQKKGQRSRAEAEIAAMSAALESYKADNGVYPTSTPTNTLMPTPNAQAAYYAAASLYLYQALSGNDPGAGPNQKSYFAFKPQMLKTAPNNPTQVLYLRDPFGNSYGYSTAKNPEANPTGYSAAAGYNPTFDLWSTGGSDTSVTGTSDPSQWIKNW
ncbi:MAG: type II secretion system protein GspG [Chthoniobacterales bacterium]